jgi:AcrR family transcriptional regulator
MPISDCEVRDPRIRRTRQSLQAALRTLLHSRSFDEISVQDITDTAAVNRATFYDHYADKFTLLDAMIAGGFHQMLSERQVHFDGTCPSAARAIIQAACDYLVQMHAGRQCRPENSFEPFVDAAITAAIAKWLTRGNGELPAIPNRVAAGAASWAIFGAAKQWFRTPDRPSVDEIVPEILRLVVPLLTQAFALEAATATSSLPGPDLHA